MSEAQVNPNQMVQDRREEILRLAAKHGALNVRVFVSELWREAGPPGHAGFLVDVAPVHSSWFPGGLLADLEDLLGCRVHIVTKKGLNKHICDRVSQEAVPL